MDAEYRAVDGALPYALFDALDEELVGGLPSWRSGTRHEAVLWSPIRWFAKPRSVQTDRGTVLLLGREDSLTDVGLTRPDGQVVAVHHRGEQLVSQYYASSLVVLCEILKGWSDLLPIPDSRDSSKDGAPDDPDGDVLRDAVKTLEAMILPIDPQALDGRMQYHLSSAAMGSFTEIDLVYGALMNPDSGFWVEGVRMRMGQFYSEVRSKLLSKGIPVTDDSGDGV